MATRITANDGSDEYTEPTLVLGYQVARRSQNVIHDLIGGGIAVTLVKPRPRSGTLRLFYLTEDDGADALALHSKETTFSLTEDDRATWDMTYVIDGNIQLNLEDGEKRWVLAVDFQEVEL